MENKGQTDRSRIKIPMIILSLSVLLCLLSIDIDKAFSLKEGGINIQVPSMSIIYQGIEHQMTPIIVAIGEMTQHINAQVTPDDAKPQLTLHIGDNLDLTYAEGPATITAYLIDYDADTVISTPQKVVDEKVEVTGPEGIRTLEIRCTFPDGKYVSYSTLVNVT